MHSDDRLDTFDTRRAIIHTNAARAFARHAIKQLGEGEWHCAAPATGMHSFTVICRPGTVLVWGDVGDWILRHSDRDSVEWLTSHGTNWHYVLGKLVNPERVFYKGDAFAYARERVAEDPSDAAWTAVLDNEADVHDADAWGAVVQAQTGDAEACSIGTNYGSGPIWLSECLRWFVEHLR